MSIEAVRREEIVNGKKADMVFRVGDIVAIVECAEDASMNENDALRAHLGKEVTIASVDFDEKIYTVEEIDGLELSEIDIAGFADYVEDFPYHHS